MKIRLQLPGTKSLPALVPNRGLHFKDLELNTCFGDYDQADKIDTALVEVPRKIA